MAGPVTVDFAFTSKDLETYYDLTRRRAAHRTPWYDQIKTTMMILAVLAVSAGFAAHATGAVPNVLNPTVALLCALVFFVTRYLEKRLARHASRTAWREAARDVLDTRMTMVIDVDGISSSSPRQRHWYAWSDVRDVTSQSGLVVFWGHAWSGTFLPRRAMSDEQVERLRTLVQSATRKKADAAA